MKKSFILFFILFVLLSCSTNSVHNEAKLNEIARSYVKLVLTAGLYDDDFVDAYYGPVEYKPKPISPEEKTHFPATQLITQVDQLLSEIRDIKTSSADTLMEMRRIFLEKHLLAVKGRIEILSGEEMTFNEETKILFDAVAPDYNTQNIKDIPQKLDAILPGKGDINERYNKLLDQFIVPEDKIDTVFQAALQECRKRTKKYIDLPQNEEFKVEYVTDKSWGAYNWYKGNGFSIIQLNTDLPFYLTSAVGLTSHEGYPGHHVNMTLLDKNLYQDKKWLEFSVYPLFSPLSFIAEGVVNFGVDMIFPDNERIEFEKNVLVPLAGLDTTNLALIYKVKKIREPLQYARLNLFRDYLDGKISREETIQKLVDDFLVKPERAEKNLDFLKQYRSYIVNYTLGEDIVRNYINKNAGATGSPLKRWALFKKIISTPCVPSGLQ